MELDAAAELLVLVADELDQLLVGHQPLIDAHRPWLRVRLGILDRQIDLQMAVSRPPDALGELGVAAVRAAVDVHPAVVGTIFRASKIVGLDDERVPVPSPDGIAIPPRLRLTLRRQRPAVQVDVADAVVRLVLDQDQLFHVVDPARLRLLVELQEAHRHAHRVGIVLGLVDVESLLPDLPGPVCVWKTAGDVAASLEERGHRRTIRIERKTFGRRFELDAASASTERRVGVAAPACGALATLTRGSFGSLCSRPFATTLCSAAGALATTPPLSTRRAAIRALPCARKVRLAVRSSRRRRCHDHVALRVAGHACLGVLRPLC